ncbi:hypothetical protein [Leptospira sp. GIMC2001]|uniref:hypothetical protein n=1 Tax=Leptospira sp. GIMC2001 TaxID=1513297 RepID=UPI002349F8B1|nr:hypothetical protein [Leptospira sp. GIMC2001]WCL50039.1 hypothetical protein O4O04_04250 [Leptospira sp. GIMC2001]
MKITKILIYSTIFWFAAILLSPAFGIHIHHNPNQDSIAIIHSYLSDNHDMNRSTSDSEPQTLIDHITSSGLSKDMGNWDLSIIAIVCYLLITLELLRTFLFAIPTIIIKNFGSVYLRNPEENFHDFRFSNLHLFKLPPPIFN